MNFICVIQGVEHAACWNGGEGAEMVFARLINGLKRASATEGLSGSARDYINLWSQI